MSVNNVNTVSNVTAVSPINFETTEQTATRDSVPTRQNAPEQTTAAGKAVLVALQTLMSTELDALARTIATRTTLMSKLPPDLKELAQKILSQTQAAQTALPAGLAALLTSSRSAGEKLSLLAAMLEEAAGTDTATKAGEQANGKNAGKQQVPAEVINTWRDSKPDELKAAAKMLKELATAANQAGKQVAQELPAKTTQPGQPAVRQQEQPTTSQPGQAAGKQPDTPAPQAGRLPVMQQGATAPQPARVLNESPDAPVPASQLAEEPDAPLARPNNSASQQENRPAIPQKPNSMAAENKNPAAALPAADTPEDNSAVKQQAQGGAARSGGGTPEQPEAAVLARMLAARPEVMKNMPAEIKEFIQVLLKQTAANKPVTTNLPEPLASLLKSPQPAADKITMLARMLEEAAGLFRPEGRFALQTAVGGQQVLAELINAWRNKNQEEIKAAAKAMRELADTMPKPGGVLAERQASHNVLSFTVPLYFGDAQSVYPAHIHVYYQEEEDKKNPGQQMTETWLRICLETENIGMVETAFRLYDGQSLDVKVRFDDSEAADSFADSVPAVKEKLGQLPFQLGEFLVK